MIFVMRIPDGEPSLSVISSKLLCFCGCSALLTEILLVLLERTHLD